MARAADKNAPMVTLSLDSLGVPALSTSFLNAGASILTVNFLDDHHLLVTYGERGLVPRLPDDPKDDDDRLVAAEIVELPGGKVLAKTQWHMHDHARYLWALGPGRFMVRMGNVLYLMTPLSGLADGHPFARSVFPWRMARPGALFVSEDGGLLTIESQVVSHGQDQIDVGDAVPVEQKVTTMLDFYRLSGDGSPGSPVAVSSVGSVRSPQPFYLPIDSRGYLWPTETGNSHWAVMYDDMRGKTAHVGTLDSTCTPRLEMVSHAVYIALTCRGADDRVRMQGYGLDAQETWEEDFGDFGAPVFAYAPEAGRFAFSRKVSDPAPASPLVAGLAAPPDTPVDRQSVRVYQSVSGELLLKVDAFPAMKTMENFALAEDGSELAVVREGAVEVFRLPELKPRDKNDIAEAAKLAPPADEGPVMLSLLTGVPAKAGAAKAGAARAGAVKAQPVDAEAKAPAKLPNGPVMTVRGEAGEMIAATPIPGGGTSAAALAGGALAPSMSQSGEVAGSGKKKPPTLLYPGEHAEYGGSATDVPQ
jgi:hypothetical protein